MRQDAVTRDRRYGPLMAKRSEEEEEEGGVARRWGIKSNDFAAIYL